MKPRNKHLQVCFTRQFICWQKGIKPSGKGHRGAGVEDRAGLTCVLYMSTPGAPVQRCSDTKRQNNPSPGPHHYLHTFIVSVLCKTSVIHMTQLRSFLHFLKLKPTSIRLQIGPIECIEYQVWKHMHIVL